MNTVTSNSIGSSQGVNLIQSIEDIVLAGAAESEQLRTLSPAIVDALWSSGLMTWMNPREAAGQDPGFEEMIDTWQEMARIDASTGWIGIANLPSAAFAAAYLCEEGFKEVFAQNDCKVTMAGQFFPNGMGEKVDGGYNISGAWQFGSGTGHSHYIVGGFMPTVDGEMLLEEDGMPKMLVALFPAADVTITDGWHVQGLKATGSYDYNVQNVFVPEHLTYELYCRTPQRGSKLYSLGLMPLVAAGHAAWALGVGRSMLDDAVQLALTKTRMGDSGSLAEKSTFQRNYAHHESMWRAARRLVIDTYNDVEQMVQADKEISLQMRADMRLAATYATEACREVSQWAHLASGTAAIREGSRLERAFRDMYTGTQHAFISEKTYLDSAQVSLGLIDQAFGL